LPSRRQRRARKIWLIEPTSTSCSRIGRSLLSQRQGEARELAAIASTSAMSARTDGSVDSTAGRETRDYRP